MDFVSAVGIDHARKLAQAPYDRSQRRMAVAEGFAECLAERGLLPSDVDRMMAAAGSSKTAGGPGDLVIKGTLGLALVAALAGNYTGRMHHSVERRLSGKSDNDLRARRLKLEALAAARDELKEDIESRPRTPQGGLPRPPAPKAAPIELLD